MDTIKSDISFCNFIEADYCEAEHWYDCAMKLGVKRCKSEYVLFLEPDLDIDGDELFGNDCIFDYDVITIPTKKTENYRLWPAFFMTRFDLVKNTRLEFAQDLNDVWNTVVLDGGILTITRHEDKNMFMVDNFDKFANDIINQTKSVIFTSMLGVKHFNYTHLCWNWNWCRSGKYDLVHKPQRFVKYLSDSMNYDVKYDSRYIDECNRYIQQLRNMYGIEGDMSDGR
jgi:hypothetical protein